MVDKGWAPLIRLGVDENGIVDLTQWRDVKSSPHAMAYESALSRCSDADGPTALPLGVVYQRLASFVGFEFLLTQLLYAISLRLEVMLKTYQLAGGKSLAQGTLRLRFPDQADLAAHGDQPYLCAAYVHHCRSLTRRLVDTGIATDQGSAHRLPLQTTVLSWPRNFAAVAPPQVAAVT